MFNRRRTVAFTIFTLLLIAVSASFAAEKVAAKKESPKNLLAQKGRYLRIVKDADGELDSLQTAIIRLVPEDPEKKGLTIDLVGAIHVAEP